MVDRVKKPSALKHGAYSTTAVLPGEDRAAYERLHRELAAELRPNGTFEDSVVADLARLIWRKENLGIFRTAELAQYQYVYLQGGRDPDAPADAAEQTAPEKLGDRYRWAEMKRFSRIGYYAEELRLAERLDGMIDRCLKRLLFVRGLKSMSPRSAAAQASTPAAAVGIRSSAA